MEIAKTFTNFLPREWADTLLYAKSIGERIPHFESYLEAREVDTYSSKHARVIFQYMRDVAGKPLPAIEKHVLSNPQVAEEYLKYKMESDPKNDDGGTGVVMTLLRRLRSPRIKADVKTKVAVEPQALETVTAQSRSKSDEAFIRYISQLVADGKRKSFDASFMKLRNGVRHVGQFTIHGSELAMVVDTEWFVFDPSSPSKVVSIGHWPKDAKFEQVRNGHAIKSAAEQLSKMEPSATIPATFVEKASKAEGKGTLSLVQGKLLLSYGQEDKQFRYETEFPFKCELMSSPVEHAAFIRRTKEFSQAHEARKTNILTLIEKTPEGITDQHGYHYKLADDGETVTKTLWRGKTETFSRDKFNAMETSRLAPRQEQAMTMGRSMRM